MKIPDWFEDRFLDIGGAWWCIKNGFIGSGLFKLLPYHRRLHDIIWWFRHRFVPRTRFHVVDTGLPYGWYDVDTRILHASFELLCGCIEKERLLETTVFDRSTTVEETGEDRTDVEGPKAEREIRALYHWWRHLRPIRDQFDPLDIAEAAGLVRSDHTTVEQPDGTFLWVNDGTEAEQAAYRIKLKEWADWEHGCYEEDTANLIRLMRVRSYLWT